MPATGPNDWFDATRRAAGGVELRPRPRLTRRAALLSAAMTWSLTGVALGVLSNGRLLLSTAYRKWMTDGFGVEPVWRAVELCADAVTLVGAAVLLALAVHRSYRKGLRASNLPLVVAADGAVGRGGQEFVAAGRARCVCVELNLRDDGEGGAVHKYRVCVTDHDMARIPVPCPETTFGVWHAEGNSADDAMAFAILLGEALGVPVHPVAVGPTVP